MTISTAGDIVMDVMRAADPAALREARLSLQAARAGPPQEAGGSAETARAAFERVFGAERLARGAQPSPETGSDPALLDSYRSFEGMVLQMFVRSMLPSDAEEVYGSGTAGEIWKGMMAEQIGEMIAKGGGVGIAGYLSRQGATLGAEGQIAHAALDGGQRSLATGLLHELQRATLKDWSAAEAEEDRA